MATPVQRWVEEMVALTTPDAVYWCTGTDEEARELVRIGIEKEKLNGPTFRELNHAVFPNAYYHRSHPTDVARVEHLTFVCQPTREAAGPNNNWMAPDEAKEKMRSLMASCMKGRTMYVLPYMMGHPKSPYAKACVQLTDSVYVAVSMRIMTRLGTVALERIGAGDRFVKGLHSIGDLNPERRFIMHFPQEDLVMSVGSGYGGNALLGKKCFSLRIASCIGAREGWLAEHMIIAGVTDPAGTTTYITGAFPSACGKTNLAMLDPTLPGWRVETLGDDIAWLNPGPDGRLYAINPESGFFGVAPNTAMATNPNMMRTLKNDRFYPTLFTNTAIDLDTNTPWWDGLDLDTGVVPKNLLAWQGTSATDKKTAAHPNSRFTVSMYNCPVLSKEVDNPNGVPVGAILFGARRSTTAPLVVEAYNWRHGVFSAATMGSETTAAASHAVGTVRRDPMAMLPFCGYNMGDYFAHYLKIGAGLKQPPKIFLVNWFLKDETGKFLWPGFRENIRVIKWILDRVHGRVRARETAIGLMPYPEDIDVSGLTLSAGALERLLFVDTDAWKQEIVCIEEFFRSFGDHMPQELWGELAALRSRLRA